MSIKIGDKVRFLNDVGGGIVSAFSGKNQVIVDREDGFGFPVLISECVLIPNPNATPESRTTPSVATKSVVTSTTYSTVEPRVKRIDIIDRESLNISLAYLPVASRTSQSGSYEAYLINSSDFSLYFTYLSRQNGSCMCRYSALIEAGSRVFIEEFSKEELNDLEHLQVQIIAFREKRAFDLQNAISVDIHLDTVKFYKSSHFTRNGYFHRDAFILPIVKSGTSEYNLKIDPVELQKAILYKKQADSTATQPANKKTEIKSDIIETDLHSHELLDSTVGMSNTDILLYQIDVFRRVIKEHKAKRNQKLIFIHGKGDGVLRKALEKELRTHNKHYTYQDASFCQYGFGAIMVIVR